MMNVRNVKPRSNAIAPLQTPTTRLAPQLYKFSVQYLVYRARRKRPAQTQISQNCHMQNKHLIHTLISFMQRSKLSYALYHKHPEWWAVAPAAQAAPAQRWSTAASSCPRQSLPRRFPRILRTTTGTPVSDCTAPGTIHMAPRTCCGGCGSTLHSTILCSAAQLCFRCAAHLA